MIVLLYIVVRQIVVIILIVRRFFIFVFRNLPEVCVAIGPFYRAL